jgi:deoxyribose-phosphate aldolase
MFPSPVTLDIWRNGVTAPFRLTNLTQRYTFTEGSQNQEDEIPMTLTISSANDIARIIDHTALKPTISRVQVAQACQEALEYEFAAACLAPVHVPYVAELLAGSTVAVGYPVAFPLGAHTPEFKAMEAEIGIAHGATEVDMVINIGALKEGSFTTVEEEISQVAAVCHSFDIICKAILETAYLTEAEKVKACQLAKEAGADYVKTSTGFAPSGATPSDVALMRQTVGPDMGVKAAGGIRTLADVLLLIEAGATRIGTSASVSIIAEAREYFSE